MIYVTDGEIAINIDNVQQTLRPGGLGVIFPGTVHAYSTENRSAFILSIFNADLVPYFQNRLLEYAVQNPFLSGIMPGDEIDLLHRTLLSEAKKSDNIDIISAYLNLLLARILEKITIVRKQDCRDINWLPVLLNYISVHYTEKLPLPVLSKVVGISPYHLSRVFCDRIGVGIPAYINQLRINLAVQLLRTTDSTVTEICYECGYENVRTFNRSFKKLTGHCPNELRAYENPKKAAG